MTEDDEKEFARVLIATAELYGKKITEPAIELYWNSVNDFTIEQFKYGLKNCCTTSKFFPVPAAVREWLESGVDEAAAFSFDKLVSGIRSAGGNASVVFDDAIIHVVVEHLGGWIECCKWLESEMPFRQQDYVKRHTLLSRVGVSSWPCRLKGRIELHNQSQFPERVPAPVLIGDRARCEAVLSGGVDDFVAIPSGPLTNDEQRRLAGSRNRTNALDIESTGKPTQGAQPGSYLGSME